MKRSAAILATIVALVLPGAAAMAQTAPAAKPKDYPLTASFPGGVTMAQMVYSTPHGFRPLTLDLYQPGGPSAPRPVLVFIHGGNWNGGDSLHDSPFTDFPATLAGIAARGYVVASVNYRLSGEARFPAALLDVKTAIRWLRTHAGDYNMDPSRFAAWGPSAGGHLTAMVGMTCGVAALEPPATGDAKPPSTCVQAAIDWSGLIELSTIYADFGKPAPDPSVEGEFLGCEPAACAPGVARSASPLAYVRADAPPFLIQQGDADPIVSVKQAQQLYDALKAKGAPAELVIYPGAVHMLAPGGPNPDPSVTNKAVEKLESFLDATFRQK